MQRMESQKRVLAENFIIIINEKNYGKNRSAVKEIIVMNYEI